MFISQQNWLWMKNGQKALTFLEIFATIDKNINVGPKVAPKQAILLLKLKGFSSIQQTEIRMFYSRLKRFEWWTNIAFFWVLPWTTHTGVEMAYQSLILVTHV